MRNWFRICWGETVKQKQNYFNSPMTYVTSLVWPLLNCIMAYYTYSAFDISRLVKYGISSKKELLIFIFTGLLVYNSFWLMIQSALYIQNERENGTIEIVFLTPCSRLALVYGRALGSIIQNIWMFICFCAVLLLVGSNSIHLIDLLLGYVILLVSAVVWGGFINSIFLVSRDVDFWFNLCDCPMDLLSGTKIPIAAFPSWLGWASFVFPLTYCLIAIRDIFSSHRVQYMNLLYLGICLVVVIIITKVILCLAEKLNRKTGDLQLY